MNYDQSLQQVLLYIDAHLQDDLNADALAAVAGFSTYHFCRVFAWRVGYSVMDYVRGRRLAFAACELSGGKKVIDIALAYGFETHSGFSKAFRRHFGSTPEAYRMHARFDPPALPSLTKMQEYSIGGIVMEPKIVSLPAIHLAGYVIKTRNDGSNNREIPAFWSACLSDGRISALHAQSFMKSPTEYGACLPCNAETGEFEYMIGVETVEGAAVPAGFAERVLPPATYAVFATPPTEKPAFTETIQGTWQFIYSEWFPNSGYEYAPGCVDFELYDDRCMSDTGAVCDIYIPVVKKDGTEK